MHGFVDFKGKLPIPECSNRQTARGRTQRHMRGIAVTTIHDRRFRSVIDLSSNKVTSLFGTGRTLGGPAAEFADAILTSGIRM